MPWFAAACHPESTGRYYLDRAGFEVFRPEEHRYFIDPRTRKEKYRVRSIFAGYAFFRADGSDAALCAGHIEGVSYVLGHWDGSRHVADAMPGGWIEQMQEAGPVIIGKRKQFVRLNKGEAVKSVTASIWDFIGRVEKTSGHRVEVMSDAGVKFNVPAEMLERI